MWQTHVAAVRHHLTQHRQVVPSRNVFLIASRTYRSAVPQEHLPPKKRKRFSEPSASRSSTPSLGGHKEKLTGVVNKDGVGYFIESKGKKYYLNNEIVHNMGRGLGSQFVFQTKVGNDMFRFIKDVESCYTNRDFVTEAHFPINTRVKFIGIDKVPFNAAKGRTYELPEQAKYAAVEIEKP